MRHYNYFVYLKNYVFTLILLFLFVFVFGFQISTAALASEYVDTDLDLESHALPEMVKKYEDHLVAAVQRACRDTWCLYEYRFHFDDFSCDIQGQCQLRFYYGKAYRQSTLTTSAVLAAGAGAIFEREHSIDVFGRNQTWTVREVSCKFEGYHGLDDIFFKPPSSGPRLIDLSERLNGDIAECVHGVVYGEVLGPLAEPFPA